MTKLRDVDWNGVAFTTVVCAMIAWVAWRCSQ